MRIQPPPPRANPIVYHNFTGSNKLSIPANSTNDYVLTGTFNSAGHAVTIGLGYKGKITLDNVSITTTTQSSCILLDGLTGDRPIQSEVIIYLLGNNTVWTAKNLTIPFATGVHYAAIHISAGARLTIEGDGSLTAKVSHDNPAIEGYSGPAIGASLLYETANANQNLYSGGELIIRSGTISARGGYHAAGIGAGFNRLRTVIIIGGNVTSQGGAHGCGIGGGCRGTKGDLVVLPPAQIQAFGGSDGVAVGNVSWAMGGGILYLGDPSQKKLTVVANPNNRQNVNVLFDVSGDIGISSALTLAGLNPARWFAGTTGTRGYWETTGKIAGNVKIFSDTKTPSGQYYSSKKVTVPGTADVHIILEEPDMSTPWLFVTQDITAWTNKDVRITASTNPVIKDITRIRTQGGTWQSVSTITQIVSTNGTFYFEAENEDGNTMTISHTVGNIDKVKPSLNVS